MTIENKLNDNLPWTYRKLVESVDSMITPTVYRIETLTLSSTIDVFYPKITIARGSSSGLFSDIKICMLGSSTFAGVGSYVNHSIEDLLSDFLSRKCDTYTLDNASVPGYTTYKLMPSNYLDHPSALPDVNANVTYALDVVNADIVIINSPSNDVASYITVEAIMANFKRITDEIISNGKQFIICDVNPRDDLTEVYENRQLELAASLQNEYKESYVSWFTDLSNANMEWDPQYYLDGIHGNRLTHLRFSEKLIDKVYQIMLSSTDYCSIEIERSTDNVNFTLAGKLPISKFEFNDYHIKSDTQYYYRSRMIGNMLLKSEYSSVITATSGTVPVYVPPAVTTINLNFGVGVSSGISEYTDIIYFDTQAADIGTLIPLNYSTGAVATESIEVVDEILGNSTGGISWTGDTFDPNTGVSTAYTDNTNTFTTIRIVDLPANQDVEVKIYGARGVVAVDRVTLYEVSGIQDTIDSANNQDVYLTFAGVADVNGTLDIKFMPETGSLFGYVNAIILTY